MRFLEFLPTRSATPAGDDKFAVLPVEWDFELFSIPTGEDCSEWAELTDASTVMVQTSQRAQRGWRLALQAHQVAQRSPCSDPRACCCKDATVPIAIRVSTVRIARNTETLLELALARRELAPEDVARIIGSLSVGVLPL